MKRTVFVLSIVLASIAALVVPTAAAHTGTRTAGTTVSAGRLADTGSRQRIDFDRGWRFVRSDVAGAQTPGFDDSKWGPVALPHDFDAVVPRMSSVQVGEGLVCHLVVARLGGFRRVVDVGRR